MLPVPDILSIIDKAVAAPSSHNTQPWRFRVRGTSIELCADRRRALPVNDPCDRELTISCGAALLSLRVAAAAAGLATDIQLLPEGPYSETLAHIGIRSDVADAGLAVLADALPRRRTYRKTFAARAVHEDARRAIEQAVLCEGAALVALDGEQRRQAAELIAAGNRRQWEDPRWRRELALWMRPHRDGDGLSVPAFAVPIARAVVRSFDMGSSVAARDRRLAAAAPWLTVLITVEDDARAWLHAGQALQRALLVGCRLGLQASYLNQPVQVGALRPRLQALLGSAVHPQLLIRWGYPTAELPAVPRLPVDAVMEMQPSEQTLFDQDAI
jgi:nitroreductase